MTVERGPRQMPEGPKGIETSQFAGINKAVDAPTLPPPGIPGRRTGERQPVLRGWRKWVALGTAGAAVIGGGAWFLGNRPAGGVEPNPSPVPTSTATPRPSEASASPNPEPTGTPVETPKPSPAPTPVETPDVTLPPSHEPTPLPTPTPTSTPTETPVATQTPEIPQTKNFEEIIRAFAEFDQTGELESTKGDFIVRYSRGLLEQAGIESISVDPAVMQEAHKVTLNMIYKAVNKKVGSSLLLMDTQKRSFFDSKVNEIVSYTVKIEEFEQMLIAFEANKVDFIKGNIGLVYKDDKTGNLIHLMPSSKQGGLSRQDLDSLGDEDLADSALFDGPIYIMSDIRHVALKGEVGDEFTEVAPDPLYEVFDSTDRNGDITRGG